MNQKQKDLLCKMLQGKSDDLKRLIEVKTIPSPYRYGILGMPKDNKRFFASLPDRDKKRHAMLASRSKDLDKQKATLDKDWDALYRHLSTIHDKHETKGTAARDKLSKATEKAVIDIQFAANAEDANRILGSLPTIRELLS